MSETRTKQLSEETEKELEWLWVAQGYTANGMVIREAEKAYEAMESAYAAGRSAGLKFALQTVEALECPGEPVSAMVGAPPRRAPITDGLRAAILKRKVGK